jgi:hypothetical protein
VSNPNCTITFTARRAFVSGITLNDTVSLNVELTAFDNSAEVNKNTITTKSGETSSSLFYIADSYRMEMTEYGTVTLPDTSTVDLTTEYTEMFLRSVANSEPFTITSLDDADASKDVQLVGGWSRSRRSAAYVNMFVYSFTVREVVA